MKDLMQKYIQPNLKILLLITILVILLLNHLNTNIVFILSFIATIFIYHKEIMNTFQEIQNTQNPVERIIEDNQRKKKEIQFDEEITTILSKMKRYRKYNTNSYDEGYKYLKMFIFIVHDLERDDIAHPKQYFENAELYLSRSLNNFQSMSISVPEETYNQALKYNKFEASKLGNRIGKLCKRLHKHCYYLLYNLSLRLNKDWEQNPDTYKSEITMNSDNVKSNDTINFNWELY